MINPPTWTALEEVLSAGGVDGCVVDMDHPSRSDALAEVGRIRLRHPGLAIIAFADLDGSGGEAFLLGEHGVDAVLPASTQADAARTRASVQRALEASRAHQVAEALRGRLDDGAIRAVAWCVEHAGSEPTVSDLAEAMVSTPRGVGDLLRRWGLPRPVRLLLWGRLLQGAASLARDQTTVEEAAYSVGYSTASALARAMKRETGLTPGDVIRKGGLPAVLSVLFPKGGTRPRDTGTRARLVLIGVALAFLQACATAGTGAGSGGAVSAVLDAPPVHQVSFGVLAVDAATGRVLYERNAHRKFIPASNQKILVTAAALSLLGPDYRYRTGLWSDAPVADGVLAGDAVVVATGDPTLSNRYWPSGSAALAALADSLAAGGIRRIAGDLIVDAAAWDSTTIGDTWEVADLPWRYAATGGAFAVDEGELRVVVRGGMAPDEPAAVQWMPLGDDGFVDARLTTAAADSATRVRAAYLPQTRRIELTGQVAAGSLDTLRFAQRDPVRQAAAALHRALRRRGIAVEGSVRVVWDTTALVAPGCPAGSAPACPGMTERAALVSPPLADVVEGILEPSQNWMTEQVVRTLGAERGEAGSWDAGLDVIRTFLVEEVGIDSLDVAPRDGSGLSAYNLITPRALVAVLRHMRAGPHATVYRQAMAEPGEEDSTLGSRLEGLEGRLFAKTGTISNVNSLSGYLVGSDGTEIIFSILSNGSGLPSATVRGALDDVVRILAR
ncbi:MAG: D-alanyl-D-alanine carboxypeptidase/D-alanyl-D-alanine-endopeptidase [Longimicrobiales bacterium]